MSLQKPCTRDPKPLFCGDYQYRNFLVKNNEFASSKVEGLEVGLTLNVETSQGSLKLSLLDCRCYVTNVTIIVDGGASLLYKRYLCSYC